MVSCATALKVMQYYQMIMFVGMTMFPGPMLDGYQMKFDDPKPSGGFLGIGAEAPSCYPKAKALLYQVMNVFGNQMGTASVIAGALARPGVSGPGQSAACLSIALSYTYFILNDAMYVFDDAFPSAIPKEGILVNLAIWAALVAMCLSAWMGSGSHTPELKYMVPSGKFSAPILVLSASTMFYVVGCIAFRTDFFAMFFPDWEASISADVKFMLLWMVGNLGKVMLTNTLIIWGTCAASPFDDELKYRIIRAASIMMVFFLGSFSKDSIVNLTTGWAEDMRTPTFVQNFVVTYYVLNCWASADFKLKAK